MTSPRHFVQRILDLRERECGRLLLISVYLMVVIACYTTTKAVRDSLFVTKIGPSQLPYVYLLIAGAMGVVSYFYSKAVNRIGVYRLIRLTSLIAISHLLIFWWISDHRSAAWFYVLYVWVSLFGAITASQVWLLATHIFDAREAKRVFAWIGVGGILGGMLGGGVTKLAAVRLGTETLLLVCAVLMSVTLVLLQRAAHYANLKPAEAKTGNNAATLLRQVRQSRHLSMLVLLLSVAVVVEAFIDYEYKFVAKHSFTSKDHLTAFFGTLSFYIGVFSLLFQVVVSSRLLKRFGVGWAILLLPSGLLVASVLLTVHPALWAAALLQLIDGGFSYSIHRSGMELLYLPVPPEIRNKVKGFIDMFVDRLGRAVGGLLLLLFTAGFALSISWLSLIVCGLLLVWIGMAIAVKREYLHSFRIALQKKTIEPDALQAKVLDNATVATLRRVLSTSDERQILYALDLLGNTHPNRWRQHLKALIEHPSRDVRARTIAALAQWNDPSIIGFTHHPDYHTARVAAASALSLQWTGSPRLCDFLDDLLHDPSAEVVRQAIRTCGNVQYNEAVPLLIEKLADARLRRDARDALLKFGDSIIPELVRRLNHAREPLAIRLRIPKVLALTGMQEAADALVGSLRRFESRLNYAVLKALNRMRIDSPKILFDPEAICAAIRKERDEHERLRRILTWLAADHVADPVFALMTKAIHERLEDKLERVFRLLALIYPPHDIYSAYYSTTARPGLRPSAVEFLDNLLDVDLKETVIPLLDEPASERVEFISREAAIQTLISGPDPWLKTLAAELHAKLQKGGLAYDERVHRRIESRR